MSVRDRQRDTSRLCARMPASFCAKCFPLIPLANNQITDHDFKILVVEYKNQFRNGAILKSEKKTYCLQISLFHAEKHVLYFSKLPFQTGNHERARGSMNK